MPPCFGHGFVWPVAMSVADGPGDVEPEGAAAAGFGAQADAGLEYPRQTLGDGQAQAVAFFGIAFVAVQADEFLEDALVFTGGDTRAVVAYLDADMLAATACDDQDASVGRIEQGVADQLPQQPRAELDIAVQPMMAAAP